MVIIHLGKGSKGSNQTGGKGVATANATAEYAMHKRYRLHIAYSAVAWALAREL